ncbi:MAG TPA: phosphate/phosphite/phosphonate ABC transporter substrate-binding protein [Candidatus Eisenbacteria bacterium]|nr:phosphate/phosphite/phosphonate ABC transporter substrate-binding protein [Candidatus Eisenbacteria bacterium]
MARAGACWLAALLIVVQLDVVFANDKKVLVFGRVFDDPVRAIRDRQEFVDYLARQLAPYGISSGKILVVEKIHMLAQALREGKVDLFHDSVVPTLVLSRRAGAIPLLRQWKFGTPDYQGLIVVRKHSGINSLADLKGKVIAFEEAHSTSATVLPRMLLEQHGLDLMEIKTPGSPNPNAVGYFYGSDGNSINVLITGRADAGTTIHREFDRLRPEIRDSLKLLAATESVPRNIVAVRKDLDPRLINAIKEVLVNMDKTPEGKRVLQATQNTTKFDPIPPESVAQLNRIEKYVFSSLGKEVDSW